MFYVVPFYLSPLAADILFNELIIQSLVMANWRNSFYCTPLHRDASPWRVLKDSIEVLALDLA